VFRWGYPRITTGGFPHSEILGSKLGQQLPGAYRSRPRPSSAPGAKASTVCPCSLDSIENTTNRSGVFKVHAEEIPPYTRGANGRSKAASAVSQNSAVWPGRGPNGSVDVDSRRARNRDGTNAIDRAGARGGWSRRIPRKEVIQPQLPLRLPCYDFTPITDSTFGRCLPCGLAHGLRVFPAFVV
jgi:hypothetical protein